MAVLGVLISNRSFFPAHLVKTAREELLSALEKWGHEVITLSPEDTQIGQTMTFEEAQKCAKLFRDNMDRLDGIIVSLPNFGEETGVADALQWSRCDVPVLIQASDDNFDKLNLENRRDAYCGKLSVCNNLYQYGIKYSLTKRHTCPVDSEEFKHDIDRFVRICAVVKAMRTARLGQIGARVSPFRTVRYSEKLLQNAGMSVVTADFSEIIAAAEKVTDKVKIADKVKEIQKYANIADNIENEKVVRQAKLCIAFEDWMLENHCNASAIQCWDSVQKNYGCATCLAMSMMGEKGQPSACETDITGAVSMLALLKGTGIPPIYQDWNNNYRTVPNKCINVHCSNHPASAFKDVPKLENLDILGATLGSDVSFGALKGRVRPGTMTYLKVSTDDRLGKIKCYFGEGKFTDDPLATFGGVAVCEVPNLNGLMHHLCRNGFEHHVAVAHTGVADVLEEALGYYMGWDIYHHKG